MVIKTNTLKLDILAIAAHPDDVELSCSGTILKHIDSGNSCGILDLTKGELGTRGSAAERVAEAQASASILGLSYRENLGMKDGFIEYSEINLQRIISKIRMTRPEIVLLNAPRDRHPDHGNASKLSRDACYYSGLSKFRTTHQLIDQQPWRPKCVYYYIQDYTLEPDFVVDVSPFLDRKFESIMAFKTQFFEQGMSGPQTPISGKEFMDYLKARMQQWGRPIGADYAEGFVADRTIGINDLFALS